MSDSNYRVPSSFDARQKEALQLSTAMLPDAEEMITHSLISQLKPDFDVYIAASELPEEEKASITLETLEDIANFVENGTQMIVDAAKPYIRNVPDHNFQNVKAADVEKALKQLLEEKYTLPDEDEAPVN